MNKNIDLRRAVTRQLQSTRQREKEKASLELPDFEKRARQVVKAKFWSTCEVIMTVYALSADDFRLMCTNAPADPVFDVFTGLSLSFFLADMLLLSLATHDYFMGNMFLLDLISTLTLVLDFSFVEFGVDRRSVDNFRSARTARLGVRASRIAWTIRQTRIYKTYKPFFIPSDQEIPGVSQSRSLSRMSSMPASVPGEDQTSATVGEEKFEGLMTESVVGRKLASLTVCRVIAVVLLMVAILPLMQIEASLQLPTSVDYASELVHESLMKLVQNTSEQNKARFDRTLLQVLYYHNWFLRYGSGGFDKEGLDKSRVCPADYYSSVFAFGLGGGGGSSGGQNLSTMLELVRIRRSSLESFLVSRKSTQHRHVKSNTMFYYGDMPEKAKTFLTSSWTTRCEHWNLGISLIAEEIEGAVSFPVRCPENFRSIEITRFTPRVLTNEEYSQWHIVFFSDDRPYIRDVARMNLVSTAVICITLCVAAMFIFHDARTLILQPLESMLLKVQLIKINPLMAKEIANDALKVEWIDQDASQTPKRKTWNQASGMSIFARMRRATKKHVPLSQGPKVVRIPMETRVLENTIVKLGMLLMVGFGEAGVNIIGRNMTCDDQEWVDGKVEARAWVNGMVPGVIVECLVGVARIGNFAVMTEVLHCRVMAFVNQIAEIVHGVVDAFHGAPNSINSDEFLLIWTTTGLKPAQKLKITDMAICALVRISGAVHSSRTIAQYRLHPGLKQRLGTNYRINVTSGLHHGWAIEGAIGTECKIDASYVSHHVTIAKDIQRATEVYGVNILITGEVMKLASQEAFALCRLIDRVYLHHELRELYCFDMHCGLICVEPALNNKFTRAPFNAKQRFKYRQYLELQKKRKWASRWDITRFLTKGWGMEIMRTPYTVEFAQIFNMGLQNYFVGEWRCARRLLEHCRWLLGFEDGPSAALVDFMDFCKDGPPKNWQGVHALDDQARARTKTTGKALFDPGNFDMLNHLRDMGKQVSQKKTKLVKKAATIVAPSDNLPDSPQMASTRCARSIFMPDVEYQEDECEVTPMRRQDSVTSLASMSTPPSMSLRRPLMSFSSVFFDGADDVSLSASERQAGKTRVKRKVKSTGKPKLCDSMSDVATVIGNQLESPSSRDTGIDLDLVSSQPYQSLGGEAMTTRESLSFCGASSTDQTLVPTPRKKKIKYKKIASLKKQSLTGYTIVEDERPAMGSIFSSSNESLPLVPNQF